LARQANPNETLIFEIRAGLFDMEHVSFSLTDVLDDVARQVTMAVGGRSPGKFLSVAGGVPRHLTGDPESLGRLLVDLIGAAFECTSSGKVAVGVDVVGEGADGDRPSTILRFTVRDSMAGLTREEADSLLMKFCSARKMGGADGSAGGTELVDQLRGSIAVASEPGDCFAVSFTASFGVEPVASGDLEEGADFAPEHTANAEIRMPDGLAGLRGAHILLAEDHPVNQNLTREILVQAGCTVDVAEDGRETVSAIRDRADPYDAVLMDVQMPIVDGFEATRLIRNELGDSDLPIIAMTANVLGDERQRCLAAGMNDYVPKPIHIPDLYAALIRWIKPRDERSAQPAKTGPGADRDGQPPGGPDAYLPDHLPGIDLDTGLARAMGNRGLYAGLITQFAKTNEKLGKDVGGAIADGDLDKARFLVHGLASTAGNIGADALYSGASELEKAIVARSGDIDRLFGVFLGRLDGVLNAIRQSGVSPRNRLHALGRGETPFDNQEASRLATRCMAMLDDQDLAARDDLNKLLGIFGGRGQDEQLKRLEASLEALEFPEAREILAGICKEILA
jgi:CheY-like chemotaxis protein